MPLDPPGGSGARKGYGRDILRWCGCRWVYGELEMQLAAYEAGEAGDALLCQASRVISLVSMGSRVTNSLSPWLGRNHRPPTRRAERLDGQRPRAQHWAPQGLHRTDLLGRHVNRAELVAKPTGPGAGGCGRVASALTP